MLGERGLDTRSEVGGCVMALSKAGVWDALTMRTPPGLIHSVHLLDRDAGIYHVFVNLIATL
jgi:hypothetical protein